MKRVFLATAVLFMVGCSDEKKQSEQVAQKEVVTPKEQVVQEVKVAPVVQEAPEEVVQEAPEEAAVAAPQEVSAEVAAVVQAPEMSVDAVALYQVCSGCHGVDGSKAALGKSQIIKGWSVQKTVDALQGYKNGTYGGTMKGLMGSQVSKLSDAQITALGEHISKL
jgi:cytochrome c553